MTSSYNYEVLQTINCLILPLTSALIISLNVATSLVSINEESIENTSNFLLKLGSKFVVIPNQYNRRHVSIAGNEDLVEKQFLSLHVHENESSFHSFSAAVAAYLAHDHLPSSFAIFYSHLCSSSN